MRGIDGVQPSVAAICEKHCDEVSGVVEDRPFDGGAADHEDPDHDVLDCLEWHHIQQNSPHHPEDSVADAADTTEDAQVVVVVYVIQAVLFVVEGHK